VLGAEALVRWNRPDHGVVPPDRFIGVAEDIGLIVPISLWALRAAYLRATTWPEHIAIAVNVSTVQLRQTGICQAVADVIQETGITPSRLELETTEGVLMRDAMETLAILQRLAQFGHEVGNGRFRHRIFQPWVSAEVSFR
jgi:EAL domain-containing protein (putative c-di-GMP-specific phosphodiesterase class I)